jgi:hypothetical protein
MSFILSSTTLCLFRARIVPAAPICPSGVLKRNLRTLSTALCLDPHSKSRPVRCQWYGGTTQALTRITSKVSYNPVCGLFGLGVLVQRLSALYLATVRRYYAGISLCYKNGLLSGISVLISRPTGKMHLTASAY